MTWILLLANVAVLTTIAVAYRRAVLPSTSPAQVESLAHVHDQVCRAHVGIAAAG
jgi:hypothetical protein